MIKIEVIENTGIITLNRPEKRNALNPELIRLIKETLDEFQADNNIKCIIITGAGKAFCAGADLEYLLKLQENSLIENREDSLSIAELFLKIYEYPKPVIAAVNGPAIAGGCGIVSVCDFVIADKNYAKFGYSEVKIGFTPAIVSIFLIYRTGLGKAKQMLLSGEIVEAEKALAIGLADYLSEDPLNEALSLSKKLQENSRFSTIFTKKMLHNISNMSFEKAVEYCTELNTVSRTSEDFYSGLKSFLKK
jgi:methylglutaconyl-CoA hydratase